MFPLATPFVEGAFADDTEENPRAVWGRFQTPKRGAPQAVGGYSNGCLLGAARLPAEGPGYQAVELQRNRRYGHPEAVRYVRELGERVESEGLGRMMIGDISQPRGGPAWRHGSHQTGLDVDIWLRLDQPELTRRARRNMDHPSVVTDGTPREVDPELWSDAQAELVHLAASDSQVSRIFLDAAIKRDLCDREWEDRSWLRKIRHWRHHDDHMHVRLSCPEGSRRCADQTPPPPGDGCAELEAILNPPPPSSDPPRPRRRVRRSYRPPMPDQCIALLEEEAARLAAREREEETN
ncbi:MAG: penicillin-insensitive murein endopeptidase [Myxococcota bacterium]